MNAPEKILRTSHPQFAEFRARSEAPEGSHILYPAEPSLQLLLLSGSNLDDPLVALIPLDAEMLGRLEALTRFWRILHGQKPPRDTRITGQQRRRLRLMIQAFDGHMNGATYRDIALAIYGSARVAAEPWKTSPLRDSVIGLVEGGVAVINGGYLNLLRHRRRS